MLEYADLEDIYAIVLKNKNIIEFIGLISDIITLVFVSLGIKTNLEIFNNKKLEF